MSRPLTPPPPPPPPFPPFPSPPGLRPSILKCYSGVRCLHPEVGSFEVLRQILDHACKISLQSHHLMAGNGVPYGSRLLRPGTIRSGSPLTICKMHAEVLQDLKVPGIPDGTGHQGLLADLPTVIDALIEAGHSRTSQTPHGMMAGNILPGVSCALKLGPPWRNCPSEGPMQISQRLLMRSSKRGMAASISISLSDGRQHSARSEASIRAWTHLAELPVRGSDADLPAVIDALVDAGHGIPLQPRVQVHIVLEGLDGQLGPIEGHLQRV